MTHQARAHHVEVIMTEEDPRIRGEALPVAGDDGAYKRQDNVSDTCSIIPEANALV